MILDDFRWQGCCLSWC